MAKLLLNLRNVAEDESRDVCELLDALGVRWYRTEPSPWGISHGGLWLEDAADFARVRERLTQYQAERAQRVRAERELALREGRAETFASLFQRRPGYVLSMLAVMLLVASLVLLPWWLLRG